MSNRQGPRLGRGVEWEFDRVTFSREFSRNVVTKLLVERAEHGGWELDRVRITSDGTRRVVLRRRIIRAVRTAESPSPPGLSCMTQVRAGMTVSLDGFVEDGSGAWPGWRSTWTSTWAPRSSRRRWPAPARW